MFVFLGSTVTPTGPTATPPPAAVCTFQDARICGFTQSTTDDFDWIRNSGKTGSSGTGPSVDHTYGTPSGYYMYIETSSPRKQNDKAQLVSPVFRQRSAQCLQFYYHMYGQHISTLNVYVKRGNNLGPPIWSKKTNQGDKWIVAQATVNSRSAFQVKFQFS